MRYFSALQVWKDAIGPKVLKELEDLKILVTKSISLVMWDNGLHQISTEVELQKFDKYFSYNI